ncbi:MAG TPA: sigma-54-dependent Fis family transcriptional regulator [Rikenellaceae bacterium]|nr:sigma-54-dependent Fis family transcriptional regulator [Rikenellaceae bacterium]
MDLQDLQRLKNKFDIIGNDASLNHAIETAIAVAPTDLAVLVTGESGVGKDVIPRIIHQNSRRRTGRYLAVNCGAIPEGTINAELFGHEKGAFTGAIGERKGYFEEADGGTLFLDEIGELPKETQALLLRVLQNGEYLKVGSSKVEKTDVRVIAATNVNLAYAVATGKFREDLYYRLSGIQIKVPALRDRNKDDQYLLFRKFSSDFAEKYNLCKISLSHDAISALTSYRWPGNIRQLKNVAETVTALESKPMSPGQERIEIGVERLEEYIPKEQGSLMVAEDSGASGGMSSSEKEQIVKAFYLLKQEVDMLKEKLESLSESGTSPRHDADAPRLIADFDKEATSLHKKTDAPQEHEEFPSATSMEEANDLLIKRCLAKHDGKVKPAAEELGISERTIYRKLAKMKMK